jgi:hypothetical protein
MGTDQLAGVGHSMVRRAEEGPVTPPILARFGED